MKRIDSKLSGFARTFSLIGLIGTVPLWSVRAALPPDAYGVWDRGDKFDPKDFPFLRGLSFNQRWADIEGQPGVFNWSDLDRVIEKAIVRNQFVYLSLGVGPEAPRWIYSHGVPAVKTEGALDKHLQKWDCYPYYRAPEYKTYFQRLITEFGRHIRSYGQNWASVSNTPLRKWKADSLRPGDGEA